MSSDSGDHELTSEDKRILKYVADAARDEMPSRRGFIQGGTAAAAIGALGFGTGQATAQTQPAAGQVGTENNPVDVEAATVNAGSQSHSLNGGAIQTAWDGLVVPVADGLGMQDAIDPSQTSTPLADAVAAIPGRGTVLLPYGTVQEASTLSSFGDTRFIGWGVDATTIEFTDLASDGFLPDDNNPWLFDGLTISGSDQNNRTGGSAIRYVQENPRRTNMGAVKFRDWGGPDPVVHFDGFHPFSSHWEWVRFQSSGYTGRAFQIDSGGPAFSIGQLYTGNSDGSTDWYCDTAASLNAKIGMWNIGGNTDRAMRHGDGGGSAFLDVGHINYESGNSPNDVVLLKGPRPVRIQGISTRASSPSYLVNLGFSNANKMISGLTGGATAAVDISSEPDGPSWVFGESSSIDNSAGTSTGLVRSLGSAGTGNG